MPNKLVMGLWSVPDTDKFAEQTAFPLTIQVVTDNTGMLALTEIFNFCNELFKVVPNKLIADVLLLELTPKFVI